MDDRLIPSPCPLPMMCPAPFLKLLPPFPAFPCTLPMMYSSPPPFELSPGQDHRRPPTRRHTRAHQYGLGLNEERVVEEDEAAGPQRRPAGILAVGWLPRNVFHHVRPGHGALAPRHNFPPPQPVRVALANRKKRHRLASRAELHACMTGAGVRGLGFVQEETRTCARARARGWVARRRTKGGVEVASAGPSLNPSPRRASPEPRRRRRKGIHKRRELLLDRVHRKVLAPVTSAGHKEETCSAGLSHQHVLALPARKQPLGLATLAPHVRESGFGLDLRLTPRGRGM